MMKTFALDLKEFVAWWEMLLIPDHCGKAERVYTCRERWERLEVILPE